MNQPGKVLYTARVHSTGGRNGGASHSDDGRLDIKHSVPGSPGTGTNPEQSKSPSISSEQVRWQSPAP